MAKKKQKYAIKHGQLIEIRAAKPQQKPHKQHDYSDKAVADYIIKRKKEGKITGYGKTWSDAQIRHVIKETYYSAENEWQGKVNTKARYQEIITTLTKSELIRSEAQRGKQNVFRNLIAWGQTAEFEALGGRMWDQNNLYSVDNNTWAYHTEDGSIIMTLTRNGDDSFAHFDMTFLSEREFQQYGPEENSLAPDSPVAIIWRYRYAS